MATDLNLVLIIEGQSKAEYVFKLYSFDDFAELNNCFTGAGVYIFVHLDCFTENCNAQYIYCGKTGDLSTRFDDHHKEECIKNNNANCIGILQETNEQRRKDIETDILEGNTFPCNIQHQ